MTIKKKKTRQATQAYHFGRRDREDSISWYDGHDGRHVSVSRKGEDASEGVRGGGVSLLLLHTTLHHQLLLVYQVHFHVSLYEFVDVQHNLLVKHLFKFNREICNYVLG